MDRPSAPAIEMVLRGFPGGPASWRNVAPSLSSGTIAFFLEGAHSETMGVALVSSGVLEECARLSIEGVPARKGPGLGATTRRVEAWVPSLAAQSGSVLVDTDGLSTVWRLLEVSAEHAFGADTAVSVGTGGLLRARRALVMAVVMYGSR